MFPRLYQWNLRLALGGGTKTSRDVTSVFGPSLASAIESVTYYRGYLCEMPITPSPLFLHHRRRDTTVWLGMYLH